MTGDRLRELAAALPESDWAMLKNAYKDSPSWPSVLARIENLESMVVALLDERDALLEERRLLQGNVTAADQAWIKAEAERDALAAALERIGGGADQMSYDNRGTEGGRCLAVISAMARAAVAAVSTPPTEHDENCWIACPHESPPTEEEA